MSTTSPARRSSSSRSGEPRELGDFVAFCSELTLDTRRRFVVEDFQRTILRDFFEGATETLVLLPKKNGKSTLVAALALYHLLTTRDAECYIVASSRDQAGIILKQARKFISTNRDLGNLFELNKREILSRSDEGVAKVLASNVDTVDGVIPTLAIVDELHRQKSADLYGVFRDGLGPRDGQMVTISTAGDDEESTLGVMRSGAYRLPLVERDGSYRYCRSGNGNFVMHEWALDPDEDREDMAVVARANPASWQDEEALENRFGSPSTTPWQWARFACGVWMQGEDTAIDPLEWAECATDLEPPAGLEWRLGMDVAFVWDTTAIAPHALDEDGVAWLAAPKVLKAERKGASLRKQVIIDAVCELRDTYGAERVVIDPETDGHVIAQDLEALGFEVVIHSQKPGPMSLAAERFHAAVREKKLRHPSDPTLSRHVLNAHVRKTLGESWSFVKETKQSGKHIDALIAAAMAHSTAIAEAMNPTEPMVAVFSR
jgi:phage terminase large subunit-like protein